MRDPFREEREELLAEVENLRVEAAEAEHAEHTAIEAHAGTGNFQQKVTDLSVQLAESGSKEEQCIEEQARPKGVFEALNGSSKDGGMAEKKRKHTADEGGEGGGDGGGDPMSVCADKRPRGAALAARLH